MSFCKYRPSAKRRLCRKSAEGPSDEPACQPTPGANGRCRTHRPPPLGANSTTLELAMSVGVVLCYIVGNSFLYDGMARRLGALTWRDDVKTLTLVSIDTASGNVTERLRLPPLPTWLKTSPEK